VREPYVHAVYEIVVPGGPYGTAGQFHAADPAGGKAVGRRKGYDCASEYGIGQGLAFICKYDIRVYGFGGGEQPQELVVESYGISHRLAGKSAKLQYVPDSAFYRHCLAMVCALEEGENEQDYEYRD